MKAQLIALTLFASLAPAAEAKEYKTPPTPAEYREYKKCMERTGDKVTCPKISLARFFVCYDGSGNPGGVRPDRPLQGDALSLAFFIGCS